MVNESTIIVIVCVSFVNVIPKLSGRMDFGNKDYKERTIRSTVISIVTKSYVAPHLAVVMTFTLRSRCPLRLIRVRADGSTA
jgi:hypothetical protein